MSQLPIGNAYNLYAGYSAGELREMYDEARAMMLACMYAGDTGNAAKWKQTAIDCAVTLYAWALVEIADRRHNNNQPNQHKP